jgi:hypothetical protein
MAGFAPGWYHGLFIGRCLCTWIGGWADPSGPEPHTDHYFTRFTAKLTGDLDLFLQIFEICKHEGYKH